MTRPQHGTFVVRHVRDLLTTPRPAVPQARFLWDMAIMAGLALSCVVVILLVAARVIP